MDECCVVVGVPYSRWRTQAERGDFRNLPLLQLKTRLGAWDVWFDQAGIEHRPAVAASGHWFDVFSAIIEAARADLGLALVPRMLCERELADGTLVLVHPHVSRSPIGLSLFFSPHRADNPLLDEFTDWLLACAAHTPTGLDTTACAEPVLAPA
jgi:DNA-binding transcriptional LysR family regulator